MAREAAVVGPTMLADMAAGWVVQRTARAVQEGTHAWAWDPVVENVLALVRVGTNRADLVIYAEEEDFEMSGEFDA